MWLAAHVRRQYVFMMARASMPRRASHTRLMCRWMRSAASRCSSIWFQYMLRYEGEVSTSRHTQNTTLCHTP